MLVRLNYINNSNREKMFVSAGKIKSRAKRITEFVNLSTNQKGT